MGKPSWKFHSKMLTGFRNIKLWSGKLFFNAILISDFKALYFWNQSIFLNETYERSLRTLWLMHLEVRFEFSYQLVLTFEKCYVLFYLVMTLREISWLKLVTLWKNSTKGNSRTQYWNILCIIHKVLKVWCKPSWYFQLVICSTFIPS